MLMVCQIVSRILKWGQRWERLQGNVSKIEIRHGFFQTYQFRVGYWNIIRSIIYLLFSCASFTVSVKVSSLMLIDKLLYNSPVTKELDHHTMELGTSTSRFNFYFIWSFFWNSTSHSPVTFSMCHSICKNSFVGTWTLHNIKITF